MKAPSMPTPVVDSDWLLVNIENEKLRVFDASWYMPAMGRDPGEEFSELRIQGAQFFDIDGLSDTQTDLPHMLPSPEFFAQSMRKLSLSNDDLVVVYDGDGLFSAARAWWMLRVFGHKAVAVLDGGLPAWKAQGGVLESGTSAAVTPGDFAATKPNAHWLRNLNQVSDALATGSEQIIDARSPARFSGSEPDPRAGVRAGHIPGSINLPYASLLDARSRKLLPAEELRARFSTAGIDLTRPVITSCGSGVTACILALALERIALKASVYDGSWAEWGGSDTTPVLTSAE